MNRAALAARFFLAVVLAPAVGAAGYAAYEYRSQPPVTPGQSHPYQKTQLVSELTDGFLLGAFAPDPAKGAVASGLASFDQNVAHASLALKYVNWGATFPLSYDEKAAKAGAALVIELVPSKYGGNGTTTGKDLARIAKGRGLKWLKTFVQTMVTPYNEVYLSFAPEMNGDWYPYGTAPNPNIAQSTTQSQREALYVKAYRTFHDEVINILAHDTARPNAVKRVKFMWQPSAIHAGKGIVSPTNVWPGKKYVDIVALDGYYYYKNDNFAAIFGQTLSQLQPIIGNVPVMIGETATGPLFHERALEIANLFSGILRNNLRGLIWFDANQTLPQYNFGNLAQFHQNWMLEGHKHAITAFNAGLRTVQAKEPLARFVQRKEAVPVSAKPPTRRSHHRSHHRRS